MKQSNNKNHKKQNEFTRNFRETAPIGSAPSAEHAPHFKRRHFFPLPENEKPRHESRQRLITPAHERV